ncbi:MFS transporter [Alicyclobacillus curvatus]|nr:MFS transporter [Alicyclobacillus curvatus]
MMDHVVLTSLILLYTHSALWVSLSLAARTVGGLLSSLSSGILADRMDRRMMMIWSDILRALAVSMVIVWQTNFTILSVSFLVGFLSSFFQVGFSASIPRLYAQQSLVKSNSVVTRLTSISIVSGFLLAGIISTYVGFRFVLVIDGLSYLFSAVALFNLKTDAFNDEKRLGFQKIESKPSLSVKSVVGDLTAVLKYLLSNPLLSIVFAGYLVEAFSASAHNLAIPLLAQGLDPHRQTLMYGLIWSVWGVGNVLATVIVPKIRHLHRHIYLMYWLSGICMSLGFISFLSSQKVAVVLPLALVTGIFDAMSGTVFSVIQQSVDDEMRGRVIGVSTLLNRGGFVVGFLVAPVILRFLSMPQMVQLLHGVNVVAMLVSLLLALLLARSPHVHLNLRGGQAE